MPEHIRESGYLGQIEIGGIRSPITYKLKARRENDGLYRVAVSLTASRDWLLKQGFRNEATLVRIGGTEMPVHFEETLNVADNISVTLHADDAMIASMDELKKTFPELCAN